MLNSEGSRRFCFAERGLERLWLVVVLSVISLPSSRLGSPACAPCTRVEALYELRFLLCMQLTSRTGCSSHFCGGRNMDTACLGRKQLELCWEFFSHRWKQMTFSCNSHLLNLLDSSQPGCLNLPLTKTISVCEVLGVGWWGQIWRDVQLGYLGIFKFRLLEWGLEEHCGVESSKQFFVLLNPAQVVPRHWDLAFHPLGWLYLLRDVA